MSYELLSGTLPPGTTLSTDGFIKGFITPQIVSGASSLGAFDAAAFDTVLFDSGSGVGSYSTMYRFVVRATDGKAFIVKQFSIYVYGAFDLKADTDVITADTDDGLITADTSSDYGPVIRHSEKDIGTFLHDNNFNFKVDAIDHSGDAVIYSIYAGDASFDQSGFDSELFDADQGTIPTGLTIDPNTGWIHGKLPYINEVIKTYTFQIRAAKASAPNDFFDTHEFSLTLISNKDLDITWNTDKDLGTLQAGSVSTLFVSAVAKNGANLTYELEANSRLPQGLYLNSISTQ